METGQLDVELEHIFRRLLRKMVVYGKYVDRRISGSQVAALEVIQSQEPVKVTDLAERLSLSMSAVTLLCDKLIQSKYVVRKRSSEDRRVVCLIMTGQGRSMLHELQEEEKKLISQWVTGLSDPDQQQFSRTFQRILDNVRSMQR